MHTESFLFIKNWLFSKRSRVWTLCIVNTTCSSSWKVKKLEKKCLCVRLVLSCLIMYKNDPYRLENQREGNEYFSADNRKLSHHKLNENGQVATVKMLARQRCLLYLSLQHSAVAGFLGITYGWFFLLILVYFQSFCSLFLNIKHLRPSCLQHPFNLSKNIYRHWVLSLIERQYLNTLFRTTPINDLNKRRDNKSEKPPIRKHNWLLLIESYNKRY